MSGRVLVRRRARVRGRALIAVGLAAAASLLAGCAAAGSSSITASGNSLTVYLSAPIGAAADPGAQDVLAAEQLAFGQKQNEVSGFQLKLVILRGAKLSDHARAAISDTHAIAYIGELSPGDSTDSIGITNAEDLLQVSPTDTALELTQSTPAVTGAPGRYYESLKTYGRTFARVVPNTAQEAAAQVQVMTSLGVKRLYVSDDGSQYGAAVAQAVRGRAPSAAITVASNSADADGAFLGATNAGFAARTFTRLAAANPALKLFGPSALEGPGLTSALGASPAKLNLVISSPGFLARDLNATGQSFVSGFKAAYGHVPARQAIFGYEAVAALLDVLHEAGTQANNRATVVKDFFAIRNRASALGTYSINSATGDTSLNAFVFSRLRAGVLVPFKSTPPAG